jgi:Papain fold toxin 1, glutamine deamidase
MSAKSPFLYYGKDAHLSHVNPDFYTDYDEEDNDFLPNPYKINCVSCAVATDINLTGIRVRAEPYSTRGQIELIEEFYRGKIIDILKPEDICGEEENKRKKILIMKVKEIKSILTKAGIKSRFIIFVKGISPNGHVFNAWNTGKKIELIDGQNNKIVTGFKQGIGVISLLQTGFLN